MSQGSSRSQRLSGARYHSCGKSARRGPEPSGKSRGPVHGTPLDAAASAAAKSMPMRDPECVAGNIRRLRTLDRLSRDFNVFLVGDATLATFPAHETPRFATSAHIAFASLASELDASNQEKK